MEIILKHLKGDEQAKFLQNLLFGVVEGDRKWVVIQSIMDEVNKPAFKGVCGAPMGDGVCGVTNCQTHK